MENTKKTKKYTIDLVNGNIFINMVKYSIPLILTGILQLLYNAADLVIVSNFSNDSSALGAVGSTSSLINLIINLFMGLSVGTNVLAARKFVTKDKVGMNKVVHTAFIVGLSAGIMLGLFGFFAAETLLALMANPIPKAVTYLKIYFIGLPFSLLYNFMASILRGIGDTKRPLYFLGISGLINVALNFFFVTVFNMSVEGVALGTIISQFVACMMIMVCLIKTKDIYHFRFKDLRVSKTNLLEMLKIGLPAGIQGSIFSISNVLTQSSVNAFGETAINGVTAATSIEGFVYTSMNALYHASLSFTSANVAAKKSLNLKKVLLSGLTIVSIIGVGMGGTFFIFGKNLLKIYTTIPAEIEVGYLKMHYLCLPYFLCGIMDVVSGSLRGLGYSFVPMLVSIVGICGFRILWIYLVFRQMTDFTDYQDLNLLFISYPISWIITFIVHLTCYIFLCKKEIKQMKILID